MKLRHSIALLAILILAACVAPTPIAQLPSLEPSATTLPPTAAFTVAPTNTAILTHTPEPTATSTVAPTATSTATPRPSPTKVAATSTKRPTKSVTATTTAPSNAPTSSSALTIPAGSPLNVAVKRTHENAMVVLGELNQALAGASGQCDIAIPRYDAIASAPTYDVSGQSAEVQTAYGLYRRAVDTINATASKLRRICNMGGGRIDDLDIAEAHQSATQAIGLLGRALDLLPPVSLPTQSFQPAPATSAPVSSIPLSDLLLKTAEQIRTVGSLFDVAQTRFDAGFCQQFGPLYATIINKVKLNDAGRDPVWLEQYNAYKVIVGFFQNKLYRAREVCDAGDGNIGKSEFGEMRQAVDAAAIATARAYDQLRFKNLLGQ